MSDEREGPTLRAPLPAVASLYDLNPKICVRDVDSFIPLREIYRDEAERIEADIKEFQQSVQDTSDRQALDPVLSPWVRCLERGQDVQAFMNGPFARRVLNDIRETGLCFLDTECPTARDLNKHFIPKRCNMSGVDLVQLGSIYGHVIFFKTEFDCRRHHKECLCGEGHNDFTCPERKQYRDHGSNEFPGHYSNYGVEIPEQVLESLQDPYIYKIQSAIISKGNDKGDLERLEHLTRIKIRSFVESHNIVSFFVNGSNNITNSPGNNFVSRYFQLLARSSNLPDRMWDVSRRISYRYFKNTTIIYDANDCQALAVMVLNLGREIVKREQACGNKCNILAYARLTLQVLLDEPNRTVRSSAGAAWPFQEWLSHLVGEEGQLPEQNWPWRCGLDVGFLKAKGPVVVRNARQLSSVITSDRYIIDFEPGCLARSFTPPEEAKNRILKARELWIDDTARPNAPFETPIDKNKGQYSLFGTRERLTKCTLAPKEAKSKI